MERINQETSYSNSLSMPMVTMCDVVKNTYIIIVL